MAQKILSAYPDYGKAPDGYLLSITEFIAYQLPEIQEALAHPLTGIATKCKFLPSVADLKQFIHDRANRLSTRATGYRYLKRGEANPVDIPPAARRKAQVLATLGYDPSITRDMRPQPPGETDEKMAEAFGRGDFSGLKTPAAPISPEFRALLLEQGVIQPETSSEAA